MLTPLITRPIVHPEDDVRLFVGDPMTTTPGVARVLKCYANYAINLCGADSVTAEEYARWLLEDIYRAFPGITPTRTL